jgi:hypothetical protein
VREGSWKKLASTRLSRPFRRESSGKRAARPVLARSAEAFEMDRSLERLLADRSTEHGVEPFRRHVRAEADTAREPGAAACELVRVTPGSR